MSFETFERPTAAASESSLVWRTADSVLSMRRLTNGDISGLVSVEWDAILNICRNNVCCMSSVNIFTLNG